MQIYGGVEVHLQTFLTLALDAGEGHASDDLSKRYKSSPH
jgi:hypothetical protein